MTILKILQYPNQRLKCKAKLVEDVTSKEIQAVIDDLIETLNHTENCAALAASQMDLIDPPCITVIAPTAEYNQLLCLINPEIITHEGSTANEEGCMSVYPDSIQAKVTRATKVTVKALDRYGKPFELTTEGFLARCLQHEIDHLNGILFVDHLSQLKRSFIDKKVKKIISSRSSTT